MCDNIELANHNMRIITPDDIIDTYCKIIQRGSHFFFSKFTADKKARTKSAFDDSATIASNWWIIPMVTQRWNTMITGNPDVNYEQFLFENFIKGRKDLRLLSLGSGDCSHELKLAIHPEFTAIDCLDLAQNLLDKAEMSAKTDNKTNIKFICSDISNFDFRENYYDFVLFNASLHHFENVEKLLETQIKPCLKPDGKLVINEYVGPNRQQYPAEQIHAINKAIKLVDKPLRKRFKTNITKNKFSGPGILRIVIADPSECVDSASILPAIHKNFRTVVEKPFGGNILMGVFKDIAHHFVTPNPHEKELLERLFQYEDHYLETHQSDYVFGIYEKNAPARP